MIGHHPQHRRRVGGGEQLEQLLADALAGQLGQMRGEARGGAQAVRIGRALAVVRVEAEEAQQAQVILLDAPRRLADEAHPPRLEVPPAVEGVVDRAVGVAEHGVHGEVAPRGVGRPVVGEGHAGAPAVGLHILAQRGDLEGVMVAHRRDRAVVQPRRNGLQPGPSQQRHHRLGRVGRGDVHVLHRPAEQRVAHAAADEANLGALGPQSRQDRPRVVAQHPVLRRNPAGRAHAGYSRMTSLGRTSPPS